MAALPNELPTEKKAPRIRRTALTRMALKRYAQLNIQRCPRNPEFEQEITITANDNGSYGNAEVLFRIVTYPEVAERAYAAWETAMEEAIALWSEVRTRVLTTGAHREEQRMFTQMRRGWKIDDRMASVVDDILAGAFTVADLPGAPLLIAGMRNSEGEPISVLAYRDGDLNRGERLHVDFVTVSVTNGQQYVSHDTWRIGSTHEEMLRNIISMCARETAQCLIKDEEAAAAGGRHIAGTDDASYVSTVVDERFHDAPFTFEDIPTPVFVDPPVTIVSGEPESGHSDFMSMRERMREQI